jgi:hypothetical protein
MKNFNLFAIAMQECEQIEYESDALAEICRAMEGRPPRGPLGNALHGRSFVSHLRIVLGRKRSHDPCYSKFTEAFS